MPDLAPEIIQKIKDHCAQGYAEYDNGNYRASLRIFYQAWLLLPKPQMKWQQAGWVLTAIGDAYFQLGQYDQSCEALRSALHCPQLQGSPFVHLRLGQCLLESGQVTAARQELHRAYSMGGKKVFAGEEEKYLNAIKDVVID